MTQNETTNEPTLVGDVVPAEEKEKTTSDTPPKPEPINEVSTSISVAIAGPGLLVDLIVELRKLIEHSDSELAALSEPTRKSLAAVKECVKCIRIPQDSPNDWDE